MQTYIFILALLTALVTAHSTVADNQTRHSSTFSATDLMDPNLDDQMIELAQNPDRGEAALNRIIKGIEQRQGKFEPSLYGYLFELGRIKQADQQHEGAIEAFERMQTLTHWADGVYSPLQMQSLRLQSSSYAALGELRHADRIERFHLRVAERSFEDTTALVAPLWRLGDWQRSSLQYREALLNYNRALTIIDEHRMDNAYKARTLQAKALTEYLSKRCCADQTLRAVVQLSKQSPYIDDQSIRDAQINAGDMAIIRGHSDAMALYQQLDSVPAAFLGLRSKDQVVRVLDRSLDPFSQTPGKEVIYMQKQATVVFAKETKSISEFSHGDPVRLCAPDGQGFSESYADVSIEVSPEGRASDIKAAGAVPHRLMRYLKLTLSKGAYRPAIVNGKAQASTLTFRQHFNRAKPLKSATVADWRGILTEHACQFVAMR